jgi:hypothetical protein
MMSSPIPLPGSEFLFAPIGEDRDGMLVSVLSGLARSDVDPWQEAARLAELPEETATQRLASLIGALPDRVASYPESRTIAARLVALLPPAGIQWRVPRRIRQRLGGDEFPSVVDICRRCVLRAGFAILDSKPPAAGEVGPRRREGCQHYFSTGAEGEFRPVNRQ